LPAQHWFHPKPAEPGAAQEPEAAQPVADTRDPQDTLDLANWLPVAALDKEG
jgi:hypothetical protein